MVYCFAFGCNHQSLREHCKFFRFPLKDAALLGQWKSACRRVDRDPNQYDRLCSCHFKDCKKENGPTIFNGEETTEATEAAKGNAVEIKQEVKPKEEVIEPAPVPSANSKPVGPVGSVSVRRKRMRFEYVSYGVQNGKLKRISASIEPAGPKGSSHYASRRKTKPISHLTRSAANAAMVKPSPPSSPPLVNESCSNRAPMTKDQIRWLRMIDRIRCLAFREARDAGASFISVRWVANCLNRSAAFVKKHWRGRYQDCVPPTVLPGNVEVPIAVTDTQDTALDETKSHDSVPPPLTLGAAPEARIHQQRASTGEEGDVDGLHDDWDPIMEERNVIEGLLADEEIEMDEDAAHSALEVGAARSYVHNLTLHPDDTGGDVPARRRHQQRGKVTPKTRTEAALVEKNEMLVAQVEAEEEAENTPLKCGQCGRKFSTAANLERHIRLHGISVGPFVCPQCGSTGTPCCSGCPSKEGEGGRLPLRFLSPNSKRAHWAAEKRRQRQRRRLDKEARAVVTSRPLSPCVMSPQDQQYLLQSLLPPLITKQENEERDQSPVWLLTPPAAGMAFIDATTSTFQK